MRQESPLHSSQIDDNLTGLIASVVNKGLDWDIDKVLLQLVALRDAIAVSLTDSYLCKFIWMNGKTNILYNPNNI